MIPEEDKPFSKIYNKTPDLNETRISKESWERCLIIDPNQLDCRIKLTNLLCAVRDSTCKLMI